MKTTTPSSTTNKSPTFRWLMFLICNFISDTSRLVLAYNYHLWLGKCFTLASKPLIKDKLTCLKFECYMHLCQKFLIGVSCLISAAKDKLIQIISNSIIWVIIYMNSLPFSYTLIWFGKSLQLWDLRNPIPKKIDIS